MGNNESETDSFFLFVYQREKDWLECQINGIEEEIEHDLELSIWLLKKIVCSPLDPSV